MAAASLEGSYNFRDIGGTPLTGGGTTRSGVLYRSDALSRLTASGLAQLSETEIGVIVDFRTPMERQMSPDRLPDSRPFRIVEIALLDGAVAELAMKAREAGASSEDPDAAAAAVQAALAQLPSLGSMYTSMLSESAEAFAQVARLIADPGDGSTPAAVLVHCAAGKDRTGVAIALVLDAVGAERSAIVADYASSGDNLSGEWADRMFAAIAAMGFPRSPALDVLLAESPASAIVEALEWVDRERGGAASYLRSGGLTDSELTALRERLTA